MDTIAQSDTGVRRRRGRVYVSPFDLAARRWLHDDYVADQVTPSAKPDAGKETFRFFDVRPCVVPQSVLLPAYDPFGWPHGEEFTPLLKARTPLHSTRVVVPGFKFDRLMQALSMSEYRVLTKLTMHPSVLDIREQYGIYDRQAYWQAEAEGKRLARNKIMTIDVIVTYALPPDFKLRYHAISVKSPRHVPNEKDLEREERERAAMAERGWTWELVRGDAVPIIEFCNLRTVFGFARDQHLPSLYEPARDFAPVVIRCSNRGCLKAVMERSARHMNISYDKAIHLFAAAVAYGFLQVDHNYLLETDKEFRLVPSRLYRNASMRSSHVLH
ncbi:TnsA endonuclease N-terminal domain-containing protein [Paraburkholderia sp. J41]|uniref:TnsA endonuclease N-terminal domain-containing protein n=1 Tax=Paraburkholderia sp. J41 TaxID=2805433 RepID=UPI002AC35F07|nr:TnsA endonuclease N-terminal domain-containing protein [Paraburkholderia sp. J41]